MAETTIMDRLIDYMSSARLDDVPGDVVEVAKNHILDTFAAMISGAPLKPGQMAIAMARRHAGAHGEAQVVAGGMMVPAVEAAIANGMLAHADETDDSHTFSRSHPGCSTIPPALAMAERENASGRDFLHAVMLGYEINGRIGVALDPVSMAERSQLSFSVPPTMGAAAAAGALAGLQRDQYRYLFSWAAQQASGIMTFARDLDHIEKAFVFGGMPARNGLTSALMVQAGSTGVWDVFSGPGNFFSAFSNEPHPERVVENLGGTYEVMRTTIKKFCVGFPVQAPLECVLTLMAEHAFAASDVEDLEVLMTAGVQTVNNRDMPSINLQHLVSIALLDGGVDFHSVHDEARMHDPVAKALRAKVRLIKGSMPSGPQRGALMTIRLRDGRVVKKHVASFRGMPDQRLSVAEVEEKARGLMAPIIGAEQTGRLIEKVRRLDDLASVRELRPLLVAPGL